MAGYEGTESQRKVATNLPRASSTPLNIQIAQVDGAMEALPPSPTVNVPDWLGFLRNTGAIAAGRPVDSPRRTLLGLPTAELAAAAVTIGAVAALASQRSTNPLDVLTPEDVGCAVSAFDTGYYHDTVLLGAEPGAVAVRYTTMTTYADTVRRLPTGFPSDRSPRPLRYDSPTVAAWQTATFGADGVRLHARCSATPVLVITYHHRFTLDLAALDIVWPRAAAFMDPGSGLEGWFRHPVIVADPRTTVPVWLPACETAMVVCDGAAAWRSQLRRAFPSAAHVLVLDRRSPAAVDVVEEIRAASPSTESFAPSPPPGVDAWRIGERDLTPVTTEEDEDLF